MTRSAGRRDQLDPDLVRVDRPLAEGVAEAERPHDDLDQVRSARLRASGTSGRSGASERAVDRPAVAEGEEVDADLLVLQVIGVGLGDFSSPRMRGEPGVGGGEEVVVDLAAALAVEVFRAEVVRGDEVHVAVDALALRHRRVIEAPRPVAGDAREQERVVMVLAAEEVLVVVQGVRAGSPCGRSSRTSSP